MGSEIDYFIVRVFKNSDRGPYARMGSIHVAGEIADAYGDTPELAKAQAQKMIDALHAYDWLEAQFQKAIGTGPAHAVICDVHRGMSLIDAINKQIGVSSNPANAVAYDVHRDTSLIDAINKQLTYSPCLKAGDSRVKQR